jgi:hypothetical protein
MMKKETERGHKNRGEVLGFNDILSLALETLMKA